MFNSKTKVAHIKNSRTVFGPSIPCYKGKTVRGKSKHVDEGYVQIPASLIEQNRNVTLAADVMFVLGLPFFITLSRGLTFVTVQYVPRRTAPELSNAIKQVITVYKRASFNPRLALMDGEFEKVKTKLAGLIEMNTTAKNDHVAEVERKIRHVKERCRSTKVDIPYRNLPNSVIKAMVIHSV